MSALPRRLNVRCCKKTRKWTLAKVVPEHNHRGLCKEGVEVIQGREAVSEKVLQVMRNCAAANMPPFLALRFLNITFPDLPANVDDQLLANIASEGRPVASEDAANLLDILKAAKALDDDWVVEYKVDPATSRLTNLFWMSPKQVMIAADLCVCLRITMHNALAHTCTT